MEKSEYIVFIGRFQPPTNAHMSIIRKALEHAKRLIVVIGSYRTTPTIRNPWGYEIRKEMFRKSLTENEYNKINFVPLRDHTYNDTSWISELQNKIARIVGPQNKSVQLIGHFKDDSSYYLKFFPQWKLIETPAYKVNGTVLDATDVRTLLWESEGDGAEELEAIEKLVPAGVHEHLCFYTKGEAFENMVAEHEYVIKYRKSWSTSPYPPTFVTSDVVIVQAGHVLVIRRKANPGKGLWALPGGFVNNNEPIEMSAIRELKEETKIALPKSTLRKCITDSHVFDHPARSLRGRTITHAYLIELDNTRPLPSVKGADDADLAEWLTFNDMIIQEDKFFEDHIHIVGYFLRSVGR